MLFAEPLVCGPFSGAVISLVSFPCHFCRCRYWFLFLVLPFAARLVCLWSISSYQVRGQHRGAAVLVCSRGPSNSDVHDLEQDLHVVFIMYTANELYCDVVSFLFLVNGPRCEGGDLDFPIFYLSFLSGFNCTFRLSVDIAFLEHIFMN